MDKRIEKQQLEHLKLLRDNPTKAGLRERLVRLQKSATMATDEERDPRTRDKYAAKVAHTLEAWQVSTKPEERELVILLRAACILGYPGDDGRRVGARGGMANESLPTDQATVTRIVEMALDSLRPVRGGRPAKDVNAWTIHIAAIEAGASKALDRRALERVVGKAQDGRAGTRSMRNTSAERTASRLREIGERSQTLLGPVAGTFPKLPRPLKKPRS